MANILRRAVPLLLWVMPFTCCAEGDDADRHGTIRVLSYNIHHGAGMDGKLDLERIAEVIKSASPDIVSLQEVDEKTKRSNGVDQAKELARLTGMNFVFGAAMDFQGGKYGNALLTKLTVKGSENIPLPGEPRSALCVTIVAPGNGSPAREFLFIATHLDTNEEPRLASVSPIEKLLEASHGKPAIIAGDFNAPPGSPTMQGFAKMWTNAASREDLFTCPANDPTSQIDHVLHRPTGSWEVVETRVLEDPIASDHRPILAVMRLLPVGSARGKQAPR